MCLNIDSNEFGEGEIKRNIFKFLSLRAFRRNFVWARLPVTILEWNNPTNTLNSEIVKELHISVHIG